MTDDNYFVLIDNKEYGPYSLDRLKAMWVAGQINSDTLFAQPGMNQWEPVGNKLADTKLGVFSVVEQSPYSGPISDLVQVVVKLGEAWRTSFLYVIEDLNFPQAATGEWPADPSMTEPLRKAINREVQIGVRRTAKLRAEWTSGYTSNSFEIEVQIFKDTDGCRKRFAHVTGVEFSASPGEPGEAEWRANAVQLRQTMRKVEGLGEEAIEVVGATQSALLFRRRNVLCTVVQSGGKSIRQLPQYEAMVRELDKASKR